MNGAVTPVVGRKPLTTPILTNACRPKEMPAPAQMRLPSRFGGKGAQPECGGGQETVAENDQQDGDISQLFPDDGNNEIGVASGR